MAFNLYGPETPSCLPSSRSPCLLKDNLLMCCHIQLDEFCTHLISNTIEIQNISHSQSYWPQLVLLSSAQQLSICFLSPQVRRVFLEPYINGIMQYLLSFVSGFFHSVFCLRFTHGWKCCNETHYFVTSFKLKNRLQGSGWRGHKIKSTNKSSQRTYGYFTVASIIEYVDVPQLFILLQIVHPRVAFSLESVIKMM